MFEADSQNFVSAPSVPRGLKHQNFRPAFGGDHKGDPGRRGGGGPSQTPLPPPSDPPFSPLLIPPHPIPYSPPPPVTQGLPEYLKNHPVYYAGPAKTPEGFASGSFGPTTAGRMDAYVDRFMAEGGSFVMLAKGNRAKAVTAACKKYGGFYLGSIGGPAAILAQDCIKKVEVLEYPELGMEAVWRIEVVDFPAFIVVDDKGNDFFAKWIP